MLLAKERRLEEEKEKEERLEKLRMQVGTVLRYLILKYFGIVRSIIVGTTSAIAATTMIGLTMLLSFGRSLLQTWYQTPKMADLVPDFQDTIFIMLTYMKLPILQSTIMPDIDLSAKDGGFSTLCFLSMIL